MDFQTIFPFLGRQSTGMRQNVVRPNTDTNLTKQKYIWKGIYKSFYKQKTSLFINFFHLKNKPSVSLQNTTYMPTILWSFSLPTQAEFTAPTLRFSQQDSFL